MSPGRQLALALRAPVAIARLSRRSWSWLALYLALASAVLGACAWAIATHREPLRALVLDYLFPASWHDAARFVADRFFAEQQLAIVTNAVIGGSLLLVTVLLFYVQELLSASFEIDDALCDEPIRELPLWMQGWEELKLFLLFVAVQASIFWIDYYPGAWRRPVALAASYGFLFFMFAIDFLSPVMQRHEGHYSRILKTIFRHPVAATVFGALFAAPSLLAAQLWPSSITAVFAANVVSIAWAAVAGTWLGAQLLDDFRATPRSHAATRVAAWLAVLSVLAWNGYRYGALVLAVHHKSQLLKCDYRVDPSSFGVDTPSWSTLLDDDVTVGVHFDVEIHNPTAHRLEVEENRLELRHRDELMGTTRLTPLAVAPGATVVQRVALALELEPTRLAKGLDLLDWDDWRATLFVRVAPRFELPIYLKE